MFTNQAIIKRGWQFLDTNPDVKSAGRREVDIKTDFLETLEDVISLVLEVFLQRNLLQSTYPRDQYANIQMHKTNEEIPSLGVQAAGREAGWLPVASCA